MQAKLFMLEVFFVFRKFKLSKVYLAYFSLTLFLPWHLATHCRVKCFYFDNESVRRSRLFLIVLTTFIQNETNRHVELIDKVNLALINK